MPLFLVASLPDDPPLATILEFCDKQCLKNVSFVEEVLFGDKLEHFKKRLLAQDALTLKPSNVKQEVDETEPMVLGYDNDTSSASCVTSRETDLARARQPTPPADPSIEYSIVVREGVKRDHHNMLKKAADPLAKNITCQMCSFVTRCRTVVPNRLVQHAMTHVEGDKRRYHCNKCNMQADGVEERNTHSQTCVGKLLDRTMSDMDYLHEIRRLFGVCYPGLPIPFQQRAEWILLRKANADDKKGEKDDEKQFDDEKEKGSSEGPNEDGNGEKEEETGEPAAKRPARECTPPITPSSSYSIVPVRRSRKSIYYQKRPWVGTTCQVCFDVVAGYKPQRDNLMQHAVDHLDERLPGRFKCTLCGYSTHKKFHKYRHERECGLCDDRSITDPLLVRETQRVFVTCFPDVSIPLKKRGVMDDDDEDDDKEEMDEAMRKVKEQLPSKDGKKKKGREQPFECQKCGVYGRVMPARHIMLHYGGLQGDRYECKKCGTKTNSWSSRSHHQQVCPKKSSMKDRVGKDPKLRRALRRLHEECFPSRDVPESLMGGDEEEELEELVDGALELAKREGEGVESWEQGDGGEGESALSCCECGTAVDADSGSIWAHVQENHHPALRQNTPTWWKQLWKETARCFPTFKMQAHGK